jgi:DNA-binding NarL/FixJ family response regulator
MKDEIKYFEGYTEEDFLNLLVNFKIRLRDKQSELARILYLYSQGMNFTQISKQVEYTPTTIKLKIYKSLRLIRKL